MLVIPNAEATDSHDRLLEPSALALVAIQCVLIAGSLSFGVFPLSVSYTHLDVYKRQLLR